MSVKKIISLGLLGGLILITASTALAQDDVFSASASAEGEVSGEEATGDAGGDADTGGGGGGLHIGGPLLLSKYTMQAGGAITITPGVMIPKEGDSAGGGWFNFSPTLGFFIIDKLELLFAFSLGIPFGDAYSWDDVSVGFGLGARYFIDFDAFALYMGGTMGFSFDIPDNTDADVRKYFNINIMVGILLAINRHIGIDLGMRFNSAILLGDYPNQYAASEITFPMGYLGVDGFFNLFTGD
jgi:hypothetical protein